MKQFFKFLFASLFGTFLAILLVFIVLFGIIGVIASSAGSEKDVSVKDNSIIYMNFQEQIADRSSKDPFENFDWNTFESIPQLGLNDIINNLEKASQDDRIKGVFMDLTFIDVGLARMNEIRDAMVAFKDSGKFIYTFSDAMDQSAYYMASVSDKIYVQPGGLMELRGLSAQPMFFKGALDKLEIEMQVIRHGKFKSAVEPFTRENMSDANRLQTRVFVGSLWETMVNEIAESRNIDAKRINELADGLSVRSPEDAVNSGLIDGVKYRDEVLAELREMTEIDEDKKLRFVKMTKYTKVDLENKEEKSLEDYKNKIAVVYASGEIQYGKSESGVMGSKTIAAAIEKARKDEDVKAIVLRVNSPGGSSLASDIIWRQVVLAKAEKPVVVSMGNLAASGGYYISCAANKIIADENTITGSIGVFGIVPNLKGLFNSKLGITFDTVNTNTYSDMGGLRPLKPVEYQYIKDMIERIYDDFVGKVSEGRSMTYAEVDSIGQGRVWTGTDALEIGLVDEIGGLNRAIDVAAEIAELEDYSIYDLPEQKNSFEDLAKQFTDNMESKMASKYFGKYFDDFNGIYRNVSEFGVYTRMPFNYNIQ